MATSLHGYQNIIKILLKNDNQNINLAGIFKKQSWLPGYLATRS